MISTSFKKNSRERIFQFLYKSGKDLASAQQWIQAQVRNMGILFLFSLIVVVFQHQLFWMLVPAMYLIFQVYFVLRAVRIRKDRILKRTPFVLDMLILNLEAGLDFVSSLEEMAKVDQQHPLHQEIRLTLYSMQLGENRSRAFRQLATRTGISELASLAMVIEQSEMMGSSLVELLRLQSQELRHRIFKIAESQAQKAPIKILLPMLGLIFPVIFILLFVPIGIQLFQVF